MSQRGEACGHEAAAEEGWRRGWREWRRATLLAQWIRRSQGPQRAASSEEQNTDASARLQKSQSIFIPSLSLSRVSAGEVMEKEAGEKKWRKQLGMEEAKKEGGGGL